MESGARLQLPFEKIGDALVVMSVICLRRLILWPRLPEAQMLKAPVGEDAVQPSIKAAFKTESMQVAVDLQESFLINVARIFRPLHQIQRQPHNIPVITVNKF